MPKQLTDDRLSRSGGMPLKVAIAVAIFGVLTILIVDPWSKPKVQHPVIANYSTTGEAARAAGARVLPTEPRLKVEPEPPMPKPIHPTNPAPQ